MTNAHDDRPAEELRIALVLNGGVSLAVWMGGVTHEIYRLVTQRHPVYRGLLQMTNSTARVDVISGTSAGGVNGAALALATLYGGDFGELRKVWLDVGAFDRLLRPPLAENKAGSLLDGDNYFLPELKKAFEALTNAQATPADVSKLPMDLKLTSTLLSGYQGQNTDDLGTALHDVDYRSFFHFRHVPGEDDDFKDKSQVVSSLARAARSTASFPFAFEPSLVADKTYRLRNYYREDLPTPRYVVDGGVLDNKPFRGAREGIFSMPRTVSVRRVLMYVNPDPGDGPAFKLPPKSDSPPPAPAMSRVVAAALVGIPGSQTVADQLHEIKEHNEQVRMRRESVLTLARAFAPKPMNGDPLPAVTPLQQLAVHLFDVYRQRRLKATFEAFVYYPLTAGVSRNGEMQPALRLIGKNGRETLSADFVKRRGAGWLPIDCPWAPESWQSTRDLAMDNSDQWQWGMFPVEFAAKVLMNVLRMIQSLVDLPTQAQQQCVNSRLRTEKATIARRWSDPDFGEARVDVPQAPPGDPIARWWSEAFDVVKEIEGRRWQERLKWRAIVDLKLVDLVKLAESGPSTCTQLLEWNDELVDKLFDDIDSQDRRAKCAQLAYKLAATIQEASVLGMKLTNKLIAAHEHDASKLRPSDKSTCDSLQALCRLLQPVETTEPGPSPRLRPIANPVRHALDVLLQLEVVEFSFNDHDDLNADALIELVQVSGNCSSALGGPPVAKEKLLGIQLAHFGAFYKRSWRANDWTHGRLDGSTRLVDALLDARRLHRVYFGCSKTAIADIKRLALDDVPSGELKEVLHTAWQAYGEHGLEDEIVRELAFLDEPNENLPDSLPKCAHAIKLRLQYGIAYDELDVVATAALRDAQDGADDASTSRAFAGVVAGALTASQARDIVDGGILGGAAGENFGTQVGSDLFTRTFAHTVATLQSTLASKASKLGPVSKFFATLRLPVLGFHVAAQGLTRRTNTASAVTGSLLAVGLCLVLLGLFIKEFPASFVTFGWLILACGLFLVVAKAPRPVVGFLLLVAVVLAWLNRGAPYVPAILICLVVIAVNSERLQTPLALVVVALAGWYSWDKLPEQGRGPEVLVLAGCIVLTTLMAYLHSAGILAKWDRSWRKRGSQTPP